MTEMKQNEPKVIMTFVVHESVFFLVIYAAYMTIRYVVIFAA